MPSRIVLACATALAVFAAAPASAQSDSFPSRPITIIVPFAPGGSSDVVTRLVAQKLSENLKTNVVVDNRGGGGGVPGAMAVKQAAPDGHTLLLANNGVFGILPALTANMSFDPVKDFQPITTLVTFPSVLVVPDSLPARNVRELVALSKQKPGGLNYASQGVGSGGHILGEMLRLNSGAPFTHVPYRGAGPGVQDLVSGKVDLMFSAYASAISQVEAGKLRVLGWTATKRSPALPEVPTMAEAGFPGTELEIWHGIVAPAGTPANIVRKLHDEFARAAKDPELVSKVGKMAAEMTTLSPDEHAKLIASDLQHLRDVVQKAGIKAQ